MNNIMKSMVLPALVGLALLPFAANAEVSKSTQNAFKLPANNQLQHSPISKYKLAYCYTRYFCRRYYRPSQYYRVHYRCYRGGRVIYTRDYGYAHKLHYSRGYRCVKVTRYYRGYNYRSWNRCYRRVICR